VNTGTPSSASEGSGNRGDEKGVSSQRPLEEALNVLETRLAEKASRVRAREIEGERAGRMAERARASHLAVGADEKEALGAKILERVKQLRRDQLIRKARRYIRDDWGGFVPIYEREITNTAELLPDMPTDREVTEIYQLSGGGLLTYNQIYRALHFAEGMMQSHVLSDPLRYGIRLGKPADFRSLSINSVKALMEALEQGEPYRNAAQRIAIKTDRIKEELEEESRR
jgi:hypothetical protein